MNTAAYCRVSTDKADQFNSLEAQKEFFLNTQNALAILWCAYMQMREFPAQRLKTEKSFCV